MLKQKLAFLCIPGLETFVKPFVELFQDKYEIRVCFENSLYEMLKLVHWADIIWIEWANELAIKLTNNKQFVGMVGKKQLVVRFHSYEVFTQMPQMINWDVVTDLVFVADHVFRAAADHIPDDLRVHHIPNGIDMTKYSLNGSKTDTKQLAFVGHINNKKGPTLLVHAFQQLQMETSNAYHLHIVGDVQDKRYDHYFSHIFSKMGLLEHITFHGFVEDINGFYEGMSHVLCTSPWESQNMGVMEGMACGCLPLIHNFPGSDDIYPEEFIWTSINDFVSMAMGSPYEPEAYRFWVGKNFNLEGIRLQVDKLFEHYKPKPEKPPRPLPDSGADPTRPETSA